MDRTYDPVYWVRRITNIPVFQYFCDLPRDVRLMIYEECFKYTYIHFRRMPKRERVPFITHTPDNEIIPSENPSLLSVSKAIREEALPIFTQCIACVVLDGFGLDSLPRSYLTHVKEVGLTNPHITLVSENIAPRLQVLRIWIDLRPYEYDCHVYGSTEEELCKGVVALANAHFEGTSMWNELLVERSTGEEYGLPFKVHLCLRNLLYGGADEDDERDDRWDDVEVDWEEDKVVKGWPAPH